MLIMLAVDAVMTVIVYSPFLIYTLLSSVSTDSSDLQAGEHNTQDIIAFSIVTSTNCFVTPIIYLIFNSHYRVRSTTNMFSNLF